MVAIKLTKSLTPARIPKFFNLNGDDICQKAKRAAGLRAVPGSLKKGSIYPRLSNSDPIWRSRRPAGKGGYPRVFWPRGTFGSAMYRRPFGASTDLPALLILPFYSGRTVSRSGGGAAFARTHASQPQCPTRRASPLGAKRGRYPASFRATSLCRRVRRARDDNHDVFRREVLPGAPRVHNEYRTPALRNDTMARSCNGEDV
jgi:hypothetical protein